MTGRRWSLVLASIPFLVLSCSDSSEQVARESRSAKAATRKRTPRGAAAPAVAAPPPLRPGDRIEVTSGPAPVKMGKRTLTTVEAGSELTALKVQGPWVKVTVQKDSKKITGWIYSWKYLRLAPTARPSLVVGDSVEVVGEAGSPVDRGWERRDLSAGEQMIVEAVDGNRLRVRGWLTMRLAWFDRARLVRSDQALPRGAPDLVIAVLRIQNLWNCKKGTDSHRSACFSISRSIKKYVTAYIEPGLASRGLRLAYVGAKSYPVPLMNGELTIVYNEMEGDLYRISRDGAFVGLHKGLHISCRLTLRDPASGKVSWDEHLTAGNSPELKQGDGSGAWFQDDALENLEAAFRNFRAETSLHREAGRPTGDTDMVALLIRRGHHINARDPQGRTPLHIASSAGHQAIAELLISKGAQVDANDGVGHTPLHTAVSAGKTAICDLLITRGAQVDAKDGFGRTPLHSAAFAGKAAICDLLISRGADVNAKDDYGNTPLHKAVPPVSRAVAEVLVAKGADVNAKNAHGQTPLDTAHGMELARSFIPSLSSEAKALADFLREQGAKAKE